jgi:hypothetical protein
MLLILAFSSDYTRWRFPFIALGFFFTFCGFVIYAAIDVENSLTVAYYACFMMVSLHHHHPPTYWDQLSNNTYRLGEPQLPASFSTSGTTTTSPTKTGDCSLLPLVFRWRI